MDFPESSSLAAAEILTINLAIVAVMFPALQERIAGRGQLEALRPPKSAAEHKRRLLLVRLAFRFSDTLVLAGLISLFSTLVVAMAGGASPFLTIATNITILGLLITTIGIVAVLVDSLSWPAKGP